MEKVMSVEDKIRRAEEIYYRRRNQEIPSREIIEKPVKKKTNIKLLRKMIKQIVICLIIYNVFYMIINNNYIFSEDFTNKAREILSQDINFAEIYSNILNIITVEAPLSQDSENLEKTNDEEKIKKEIQNNEENIGGAEELPPIEEQIEDNSDVGEIVHQEELVLSQMEQDANYIKNSVSFIKPVKGTISSMFGLRNPTTASVPKNHTGTDIAAVTGTKILSATEGTVIYTSSKGDYGKHLKIQINDIVILYAHCNKLYVKEGDIIKQGQEIAEVGATGNTTGPHLHFEIRYQERYIDPQLILEL